MERRRPVLELHVGGRHPLPTARELRAIADSPEVRALHVQIDHLAEGWASLATAREALIAVRKAGKFVSFELEHCGNAELYLASAGDRAWLRPMVQVHLLGVGAVLRFAGDALARFGLRFDMEAAGAYKSFGETFTRSYASPENREAMTEIVANLQEELEQSIATGRRVTREVVRDAVRAAPLDPEEAQRIGLVDGALYADAVRSELDSLFGEGYARVAFGRWHRVFRMRVRLERWIEGRRRVVVFHLDGPVVDGDGAPGSQVIAARPVVKALEAAAEDDSLAAAVLAIRSPGGSATASDVIWRAVDRLSRRKPVIAVFGDVAASGGYYIAAPAAEILVAPNTLTGSIGVVGGKLVVGDAFARLGVHSEMILGAPGASFLSAETPFSPEQRARFRAGLERLYRGFVERVAAGRKRPYDAVEPLARGRVWTGRKAVEVGLADRLGGLDEGIARAALLAGVAAPSVVDIRLGQPTRRWVQFARAFVIERVPELALLPRLSVASRMLGQSRGAPLLLWPYEVEVL